MTKMTFSDLDNMTFKEKRTLSHQKENRISDIETTSEDNRKIEIPINKKNLTSATYNKDNKVNKLVTVFANVLPEQSQNPNQFR